MAIVSGAILLAKKAVGTVLVKTGISGKAASAIKAGTLTGKTLKGGQYALEVVKKMKKKYKIAKNVVSSLNNPDEILYEITKSMWDRYVMTPYLKKASLNKIKNTGEAGELYVETHEWMEKVNKKEGIFDTEMYRLRPGSKEIDLFEKLPDEHAAKVLEAVSTKKGEEMMKKYERLQEILWEKEMVEGPVEGFDIEVDVPTEQGQKLIDSLSKEFRHETMKWYVNFIGASDTERFVNGYEVYVGMRSTWIQSFRSAKSVSHSFKKDFFNKKDKGIGSLLGMQLFDVTVLTKKGTKFDVTGIPLSTLEECFMMAISPGQMVNQYKNSGLPTFTRVVGDLGGDAAKRKVRREVNKAKNKVQNTVNVKKRINKALKPITNFGPKASKKRIRRR